MSDKEFGIPEQKKFPLDTRAHVISAIRFFNYADPQYRKELASRIIRKIHEYNIMNLTPSDQNDFYKYYHPKTIAHSDYIAIDSSEYIEHYGIKGQKWNQRRYQNEDGSLTDDGVLRYGHDKTKYPQGMSGIYVVDEPAKKISTPKDVTIVDKPSAQKSRVTSMSEVSIVSNPRAHKSINIGVSIVNRLLGGVK